MTKLFARIQKFCSSWTGLLAARRTWHRKFHKNHEQWSLVQFKDSSDKVYYSKHLLTCSRCQHRQMSQRVWPKYDADQDLGYQLAEAHYAAATNAQPHLDATQRLH